MMNLKKLFVAGAMLTIAWTTASAELVNGVRQRPNVAKAEAFQADVTYYLFNKQARMFFVGANDWDTRASVATNGYIVKFTNYDTSVAGAYEFTDSVETKQEWRSVFSTNDGGAIWVDNATETYRFWEVVEQPDGAYRISNNTLANALVEAQSESNITGKYLGWAGSDADTRLYFVDPAAEGAGVDWVFVTEDTYKAWTETWAAMKDQFNAAADLLPYINSAKEKGVDVSAEVAIYENEASTVDELKAAIVSVQKKINASLAGNPTVEKPSDMTGVLVNPNFDDHSADGWKGTAPGFGNSPHPAAEVAEFYGKTFNMYQDLKAMPAGIYKLSANAYNRGSWEGHAEKKDYVVSLYAETASDTTKATVMNAWDAMNTEPLEGATSFGTTAGQEKQEHDGVTYYIPSDPSGARVAFERGLYMNNLYFALSDDDVRLGIRKDTKIYDWDWECVDNFKLTYYGNAPEAYQYWVSQYPMVDYSGTVVSEQYLKAYSAAYETKATNKAEALAAIALINAASDNISKNSELWTSLQKKYDDGMTKVSEHSDLIASGILGDYLQYGETDDVTTAAPKDILEATEKTGDNDLSNEELQNIIDVISALMDAVDKEIKEGLQPGTDVTKFMTNPGFEDGKNGWTIVSKGSGNVQLGGNDDNHCFEAWHSTNFDVYQELKNLPVGVYEVSVNGYMRYLDGGDAIKNWNEAPADVPIYVYMNDSKTNFVNWLSYPKPASFYEAITGATFLTDSEGVLPEEWNGGSFPDNMIAASAAFADGGYLQSAKCLVTANDSITRIGVKGTPEAKFWPIFDNFKLTYLGMSLDVVKPLLQEKVDEADALASSITTKSAKAAFTTALAAAKAALAGEDGNAVFAQISEIEKAISDYKEGNQLCVAFQTVITDFMVYAEASNSAYQSEALQLGATINALLEGCELDEADIKTYKMKLREMQLKMELPADYAQGTAEGKDLTPFIQSATFSKISSTGETNSIDGWQGTTGYNFGNDDTQKAALALEFYNKKFDMYQDLATVGEMVLPKGNYLLQVNAFNRPEGTNPAYLYAMQGKDTLNVVALMKHADGYNERDGESGPNNMVSSVEMFNEGRYLNQIGFRFDGDTLRIGIKHPETAGSDWIIMDNFKLFFYGDNVTDGVEAVVNVGTPVQVQYFTLDGRQVNAARKGLVIRKTIMDNGTVIVRKIQK